MTALPPYVLLIGGSGFIGRAIVKQMSKMFNLIVMAPNLQKLSTLKQYKVITICGEIKDVDLVEYLFRQYKITTIVHLASNLIPASGFKEYQEELREIVVPSIHLMKLCAAYEVKFVFLSSGGTVYGEPQNNLSIKEDCICSPISYYGLSKKIIEESILFENSTSRLKYLILRPSNAYGPGQNVLGQQGLIGVAINKSISHEPLEIWGNGDCIRDYIYIDDLSFVITQLLNKDINDQIINISSGKGHTINNVIDIINKISDQPIVTNYQPARDQDVTSIVLDNTQMKQLVSIEMTPLDAGIRKFYEYEKSRR